MFIAILTYKKPLEEVDRFLQAHRDFLAVHYAAGDLITSGPQTPRVGGVIMLKADSRADVDAILAQDPFHIHDIADYQIVEFTPTLFADDKLKSIIR
ncbi:MAG: YciI family protein [Bacteroidales bacterium]|nr:YciI family protein [Bacteroidales bacterium]